MLVDSVEIEVKAGNGGDGIIGWRREKFVPRGGPDGGDGGRGGSVKFRASHNLDTLSSFRYRKSFHAANGQTGQSRKRTGKDAEDLELAVPVGTRIINLEDNRVMADLAESDQTIIVARGGRGGLGNVHFASATNQNPFEATKGGVGPTLNVRLELQLVADIALIGEPNAGKSSLIAALTGVAARIGAYPFSTTEPLLGVIKKGDRSITLIDLPGLIEGAHRGKGLGQQFLRHTQRVKALLLIVEATTDIKKSQQAVVTELKQYDSALADKPLTVVLNKIDLLTAKEIKALVADYPEAVLVSAKSGQNIDLLLDEIVSLVD